MKLKSILKGLMPSFVSAIYLRVSRKTEIFMEKKAYKKGKSKEYLVKWYKRISGDSLNLDRPRTYTEKQQWLKINNVTELKKLCSDKWLVRKYISKVIGTKYLVPLIKNRGKEYFENANEISFDELPESFVIQCNHGSGMTHVVKSKKKLGKKGFKKLCHLLNKELKNEYAFQNGLELVYLDIHPLIFITKYLEMDDDLPDYKIMCFNKHPLFVWIDTGRFTQHKRTVFNLDFSKADFGLADYPDIEMSSKPSCFDDMVNLASTLCSDFDDFVRVDFYFAENQIWFGELTFSSGSGSEFPHPKEWNEKLGDLLKLPFESNFDN